MNAPLESNWARVARGMYRVEHGSEAPDDEAVFRWLTGRVGGWGKTSAEIEADEFNARLGLERLKQDHEHERVPVGTFATMKTLPGEFHNRGGLTFRRMACGCVMIRTWSRVDMPQMTEPRWWFRIIAFVPANEWDSVEREVAARHHGKPQSCAACAIEVARTAGGYHPDSDVGPWDAACPTCGHLHPGSECAALAAAETGEVDRG